MTANSGRINFSVVARNALDMSKFVQVEIFTKGTGLNTQKQCSTGELLFNPSTMKFVCVPQTKEELEATQRQGGTKVPPGTPSKRDPFDPSKVKVSASYSKKDRKV